MKTTCTAGNARNGILGSRLRVWADSGRLVDELHVPTMVNGYSYCYKHPTGHYAQRFADAVARAEALDRHDAALGIIFVGKIGRANPVVDTTVLKEAA